MLDSTSAGSAEVTGFWTNPWVVNTGATLAATAIWEFGRRIGKRQARAEAPTADEIAAAQIKAAHELEDRKHDAASKAWEFFNGIRLRAALDWEHISNTGKLPERFLESVDEYSRDWPALRTELEVLRRDDVIGDGDRLVSSLPAVYEKVAAAVQPYAATAEIKGGEHVRPQVAPLLIPLSDVRRSAKALYEKVEPFRTRTQAPR